VKPFLGTTLTLLLAAPPGHANQMSFFRTVLDTDFVTAGTGGLRGTGSGTIAVDGVAGTASRSFLYWQGPTNSSAPDANASVSVNGGAITGVNIGFSNDNLWSMDNSQAYRADSTSVIDRNGAYALSNFVKPPDVEADGAATVVFFQDGVASNNRDVVLFDGNDSNFRSDFDSAGWSATLNGIHYATGVAHLTLFVADGQNLGPDDDGTLRVNGTALASGGLFSGNTLPGGVGPAGNGNLFDIATFDITALLAPGVNNLSITTDPGFNDAFSLIAALVDLPAGSMPPDGNGVPEPGSVALLGALLAGIGWMHRRRQSSGLLPPVRGKVATRV
jgi:hypothetical protein